MATTCEGETGFVDDDFARDMNIYINSSCAVDRIRDGAACATLLRGVQRYSFFVMLLMMGNGRSLFFGALQHLGKAISDAASFHPPHCTNSVPETLFNYTYRGANKGLYVLLSRTQAEPGRTVKQEQEEISCNHIPRIFLSSVCFLM